MNRPRKKDKHLPSCMYEKHGSYWFVKAGKWTNLGTDLGIAMMEYARVSSAPKGGMDKVVDDALNARRAKLSASTVSQYEQAAKIIKRKFQQFSPEQVKPKHVAAVKLSLANTPNMANRVISFLRIVFDYAVEQQMVDSNPCVGIRRHEEAKRDRYITDAEYSAIYAQAGDRLQVIMDLCYLTAQRITDVLAIRRSDLNEEGIQFKQKKTGTKLTVQWSDDLRRVTDRAKALPARGVAGLFLIPGSKGKAPDYRSVLLQWHTARIEAGVQDAILHDLRAKSITDAKRQGLDAQALGGHASEAMTARYIRLRDAPLVTPPTLKNGR
jgi:integrase